MNVFAKIAAEAEAAWHDFQKAFETAVRGFTAHLKPKWGDRFVEISGGGCLRQSWHVLTKG